MAAVLCHTVALNTANFALVLFCLSVYTVHPFLYIASMHSAQSVHHGCIRRVGAADSQLR